jgi:hypothetical protein
LQTAGRSTLRTPAVDNELANISTAINALNNNIKLLQRDDGKVRDMIIEPYSLSEQVRAILATNGCEPRGIWTASTVYNFKDIVQNLGFAYICYVPHTSSAAFDSTKFIAISGDGSAATSAGAAAASEASALASKIAAALSETNAANSAGAAGTFSNNANNQANAAANSAASALSSQTIASAAAAIAASGVYSQWIVTGLIPIFVNSRTFTLAGNQTANYHVGRRVRTTNSGGTKYATIIASVFTSVTTVTLGFRFTTDAIDSGLSAADISTETYANPAITQGDGTIVSLTGYTGADIPAVIGVTYTYSLSVQTSLFLRIATSDNQKYEIDVDSTSAAVTVASDLQLLPNNAALGVATIDFCHSLSILGNVTLSSATVLKGLSTYFPCSASNSLQFANIKVTTKTSAKSVKSESYTIGGAADFLHANSTFNSVWPGVTAWTSLGTLNFNAATTGIVTVRRVS